MKRFFLVGPLMTAVIALAVWFGLPVYAQQQFEQSLDAWVAARGADDAAYADAKLDYWADTATIGSLTDTARLEVAGASVAFRTTVNDLTITGYRLEALERALAGPDGQVEAIADGISWSGVRSVSEDGRLIIESGAGRLADVSADALDPTFLPNSKGLGFTSFTSARTVATFSAERGSWSVDLASVDAADLAPRTFGRLELGALKLTGDFRDTGSGQSVAVTAGSAQFILEGLERGEPTTVARIVQSGFNFDVVPSRPVSIPDQPDAAGVSRIKGSIERIELTGNRFDGAVIALYRKLGALAGKQDAKPGPEELAGLAEQALRLLERAVALETGSDSMVITGLEMDAGDLFRQVAKEIRVEGARGLRVARMETIDQHQSMFDGSEATVARNTMTGFDMTALPAYLRRVLGAPITLESLDRAETYYRESTIADAVPVIDFGNSEAVGYQITTAEGQSVMIDRIAMDRFRATEKGNIDLAFAMEGLTIRLDDLPADNPQGAMTAQLLAAQGLDKVKLGFGLDMTAGLRSGVLTLNSLRLDEAALMDVALSGQFAGLDVERMRKLPPEQVQGAFMEAVLSDLALTLTDHGARELAFRSMSADSSATPKQMAVALAQQVSTVVKGLGTPRAEQLGLVAAGFVRDGGTLTLSTAKAPPAPVIQMMLVMQTKGPGALLELLQLEATHKAP